MKNINYPPIVLFLFFVFLIGCQGRDSVDNLLDSELKKEILEIRKMVANDLQKENGVQEDFVKRRISSMESSSTLVEITVDDCDTSVVICIFDTNALCNIEKYSLYNFDNCLRVNYGGITVFVSDTANTGVFFKEKMESKTTGFNVNFNDGLFRQYHYQNGKLIFVPLPLPTEGVFVIDGL